MTLEQQHQLWLQSMVQSQQGLDHALQSFYLACDKELATAAGYRALGMNPAEAPKFGWGITAKPNVSTTINTMNQPEPAGWIKTAATSLALLIGGAGAGALGSLAFKPAQPVAPVAPVVAPAAPATQPAQKQVEIKWWVEDGKIKTQVQEPSK